MNNDGLSPAIAAEMIKPQGKIKENLQVRALVKFREAIRHYARNRIHIKREMFDTKLPFKLTLSEHNNFAGMRPFGLVQHGDPENPKSGEWLLTTNGAAFLRGEKGVFRKRRVGADGRVIERDKDSAARITDFKKGIPGFEKFYETDTHRTAPSRLTLRELS